MIGASGTPLSADEFDSISAAIAQGVPIQLWFVLFRLTGHKQHPVRDDDKITVHDGEQFRCVDNDDNS